MVKLKSYTVLYQSMQPKMDHPHVLSMQLRSYNYLAMHFGKLVLILQRWPTDLKKKGLVSIQLLLLMFSYNRIPFLDKYVYYESTPTFFEKVK